MKRITKMVLGVCSAVVLLAATSQAAMLAPGGSTPYPPPLGAVPNLGAMVGVPLVSPFAGANFSGTVTSTVWTGDAANPFGPAALTFMYSIANGPSIDQLTRFTVIGWAGPLVDVDNLLGGGVGATYGDRSLSGDTVGFSWVAAPLGLGTIMPGAGATVLVHTPLRTVATSVGNVIDGGIASMPVYAPVPEPATMIAGALLLLPFGASALRIIRSRKV